MTQRGAARALGVDTGKRTIIAHNWEEDYNSTQEHWAH